MSAFDPVPVSAFRARRARVAAELGRDVMVLHAAPVRFASRDTEYPYRPDSDVFWTTGLVEPDTVVVLIGEGGGDLRTEVFVRPRDPDAERWSGPRLGAEESCTRSGADGAHDLARLEEVLPKILRSATRIHARIPAAEGALARILREALEWRRGRGARDGSGPEALVDPGVVLDPLRMRKDRWEIDRIRHAVNLTMAGFREMMSRTRPGMGEWELEAVLEGSFRAGGSPGPAYESIVGAGANGCVLHYVRNGDVIADGDLVLVDAGATWDLHAADLTRTFPASGRFTPEQLEVYRIVEAARAAAVEAAGPGRTIAEVHGAAAATLAAGLVDMGVLEGDPAELVADGSLREYYPHQTSHWLGLDVHDVGPYARDGEPTRLDEGMILTVEPGLYFPPGGGGTPRHFAGTGIRIEDDLLVTATGVENLSADLPTDPEGLVELIGTAADDRGGAPRR